MRQSSLIHRSHAYMLLFSMRFTEVYWVVYLREKGLSYAAIGLLETVFHIASFSFEIPTGIIADRFGRKASLAVGRALSALSAAMILYSKDWTLIAASFAVNAISYTCHSGAFEALVYDSLPEDERPAFTRLIGRLNSTYLAGTAIAGGIAALVARISLDWLYRAVIAVDIVAALVALTLPETISVAPARRRADGVETQGAEDYSRSDLRTLMASLRQPELRNLLLLWGISGALGTTVAFYGQSLLKEALLPISLVGLVGTVGNLLAIVPASSAHLVQKRYGQIRPLVVGSFAVPVLVAGIGATPASGGLVWQVILVALCLCLPVLHETLYPMFSDGVNRRTGSLNRAAVLSAGGMMFSIAMMITFPLVGYLGDRLGLRWGVIAGALITALLISPVALSLTSSATKKNEAA